VTEDGLKASLAAAAFGRALFIRSLTLIVYASLLTSGNAGDLRYSAMRAASASRAISHSLS
jgi:hypothetical protein